MLWSFYLISDYYGMYFKGQAEEYSSYLAMLFILHYARNWSKEAGSRSLASCIDKAETNDSPLKFIINSHFD